MSQLKNILLRAFFAATFLGGFSSTARSQTSVADTIKVDTLKPLKKITADQYIASIYKSISFPKGQKLSAKVFATAMKGYLNLLKEKKLSTQNYILSICDFNLPSTKKRLWVIDLSRKKVLFNTLVAHGEGSGNTYAKAFSNIEDTHQSSLGFYVTANTYEGEHGTSLNLQGLDKKFNDAAFDRRIVVHGADYVSNSFIFRNDQGGLGRSWGCPAVPSALSDKIIEAIKDNTCLFIAYNDKKYLSSSVWLKKKPVVKGNEIPNIVDREKPTQKTKAPIKKKAQKKHR